MGDNYQRRELISGLLGGKFLSLYQSDPYFKANIETIAEILPTVVEVLAVKAMNAERERKLRRRYMITDVQLPNGEMKDNLDYPPEQRKGNGEDD